MSTTEYKYIVNSTWNIKEDTISLNEIISFEKISNSEWLNLTESELKQIGQLDCDENYPIQLERQNKNESCCITIFLEQPHVKIKKLIVISEARIIEFYGKHGEYICTEKSVLLGNIAGKIFFIAQASIACTNEITLKFCEDGDSVWLYGISLFVSYSDQPKNNSNIDFTNVEQILSNSNIHLTENAERAKTFIINYITNKPNLPQNDSNLMQTLVQQWNALDVRKKSSVLPKLSLNSSTDTNSFDISINGNDTNVASFNLERTNEKLNENSIKNYVDEKLQQLEERVQNNLQKQFKEFEEKQSEKLDNIIQLLQKKYL